MDVQWSRPTVVIHRVRKKRGHVIFNYNSGISWSIFIISVPLKQEEILYNNV